MEECLQQTCWVNQRSALVVSLWGVATELRNQLTNPSNIWIYQHEGNFDDPTWPWITGDIVQKATSDSVHLFTHLQGR